jgi:AcrR family transcriptional regulator
VGLREIAAAASLSRQTPGYLFGSKERLYRAVLERVSAARQQEASKALVPIVEWCAGDGDLGALRTALTRSMENYMGFFLARPSFARFILWEELTGAERLRAARRDATALSDAFEAVRKVARRKGLRRFPVEDAVLMWIALGYAPVANQVTLRLGVGRDLSDRSTRRKHVKFAVEQMLFVLTGGA